MLEIAGTSTAATKEVSKVEISAFNYFPQLKKKAWRKPAIFFFKFPLRIKSKKTDRCEVYLYINKNNKSALEERFPRAHTGQ